MTRMTARQETHREIVENALAGVIHAQRLAQVLTIKVQHLPGAEIRSGALADAGELAEALAAARHNLAAINKLWSDTNYE